MNEFMNEMEKKPRAKLEKWFTKLELEGPNLPRPYADIIRGKIRELRLVFASCQYRFLYFFMGRAIVITHGFVKKTYDIPEDELEYAERLMNDFIARFQLGEIRL